MINVSEILPLRPIKVNNGKFYLILRSGYFVNGRVFTRVYVICKICEKLRRIHSCRYLIDLSQSVLWDTGQERMNPSKKRSAGQRTFLLLTLTGDVLFGVHFESDCNGCCKSASFLRLLELGVCLVLLPDSTTRHLRVVIYYYRSVSLQWSIASLAKWLLKFLRWRHDRTATSWCASIYGVPFPPKFNVPFYIVLYIVQRWLRIAKMLLHNLLV